MARPPITALVTTYNEEHNIADCLDGLTWCEEVLVVDSFSTDRTLEIVRDCPGVRLLQHEYYGGAAQKNWSIPQAAHEWVLLLDADERCTPRLRAEIERVLADGPSAEAYSIRRRAHFLGRHIRYCGWHNERVTRLFLRDRSVYENKRVHAQLLVDGRIENLGEPMEHYMVQDFDEYVGRVLKYGTWGAAQAWRDGKRRGMPTVVFRPFWRFFRAFVLQGGFLDGAHGAMFCLLQALGTFAKWGTLWGWHAQRGTALEPRLPQFDDDEAIWRMPTAEQRKQVAPPSD